MNTKNSKDIFDRAKKVMVGGVNSPVRSFNSVGGDALVMKSAERQKLFDSDGNEYTDYCLSWGALILGHAHRNVVLGAKKAIENGTSFGTSTKDELLLAEYIVNAVPSIDKIRFVNSGTEATMSAIRLARGFTKRDLVIKFDGCYHGHVDDLLTTAGSGVANLKQSSSEGIPLSHIENTISLPYNDLNTFQSVTKQHKDKIACVIIEPVAGNMGVIPADQAFLQGLRDLSSVNGIVLIFDEIMSGFRTSASCVQSEYGIIPDMTCLGKIIGGGFPIGAYGGRTEIMDHLAPLGAVYQAGTFSGNPIVMKSGLETLKLLTPDFYQSLNKRCGNFVKQMNEYFASQSTDVHLSAYHSMTSLRFRREQVRNYKDAQAASDSKRYGELFHHLLSNGIYFPPADLESFFISGIHSSDDLQQLENALKTFFQ